MNNPLISIIVPVYQVEKYLDECVQSLVNQTYKTLEIILVDDGSRDACPEMCDAWARKDSRIKVIHKANGGASAARNVGLDIASGEYIGFVDSDDCISPSMYETLLRAMQQHGCKIASCRSTRERQLLNSAMEGKDEPLCMEKAEAINEFLLHGMISDAMWDKLYSRDTFEQIRFPEGETNEEAKLLIPLMVRAERIVHINRRLHFYRVTENSVTSTTWKTDADIVLKNIDAVGQQVKQFGLNECRKAYDEYCAVVAYSVAIHLDKHYEKINDAAKYNQKKYISVMWRKLWRALCSTHILQKDKVLYVMVITRTLRPIYRMLGRL